MKITKEDHKDSSVYKLGNRGYLIINRNCLDFPIDFHWKNNRLFDAQNSMRPLFEAIGVDVDSLSPTKKLGTIKHYRLENTLQSQREHPNYKDRLSSWLDRIQNQTDFPENLLPWLEEIGQRTLLNS